MAEKEIVSLKAMECSDEILKSRPPNGKRPNFRSETDQEDSFLYPFIYSLSISNDNQISLK